MSSLGTTDYLVGARLGIEGFDRRAEGRARVRAVRAEARRLRRADPRVCGVRLRRVRGDRDGFQLEVTVRARSGADAFRIASAVIRASIHAVGGLTAGWEAVEPCLVGLAGDEPPGATGASWAELSAAALARLAAGPALPPFGGAEPPVIDLR